MPTDQPVPQLLSPRVDIYSCTSSSRFVVGVDPIQLLHQWISLLIQGEISTRQLHQFYPWHRCSATNGMARLDPRGRRQPAEIARVHRPLGSGKCRGLGQRSRGEPRSWWTRWSKGSWWTCWVCSFEGTQKAKHFWARHVQTHSCWFDPRMRTCSVYQWFVLKRLSCQLISKSERMWSLHDIRCTNS